MKKALIVLLILAVTAGGVFAQGWTFNGYANGGLGLFIDNDSNGKVSAISTNASVAGMRYQFIGRWLSQDKNYGFDFRLRADGANNGGSNSSGNGWAPGVNFANGWISTLDGMLWVGGGKFDNFGRVATFTTLDRLYGDHHGVGTGLYTIIKPMDMIEIGVAAFAGEQFWQEDMNGIGNAMGLLSVAVTVPDTAKIVAGIRNASHHSPITANGWSLDDSGNPAYKAPSLSWGNERNNRSAAYISGAYLGMKDLHAALTIRVLNFDDSFSDNGYVEFFESFGYTGVENLSVNLGARQTILMDKKGNPFDAIAGAPLVEKADIALWIWAWASYAVTESIVPRIDFNYVQGSGWDNAGNLHYKNMFRDALYSFSSKQKFINMRLSSQFRVTNSAYVDIGYMLFKDIGDGGYKTTTGTAAAYKKLTEHVAYIDLCMSF